jgi:hypothetical protein
LWRFVRTSGRPREHSKRGSAIEFLICQIRSKKLVTCISLFPHQPSLSGDYNTPRGIHRQQVLSWKWYTRWFQFFNVFAKFPKPELKKLQASCDLSEISIFEAEGAQSTVPLEPQTLCSLLVNKTKAGVSFSQTFDRFGESETEWSGRRWWC